MTTLYQSYQCGIETELGLANATEIYDAINRTSVELKHGPGKPESLGVETINRTSVELKQMLHLSVFLTIAYQSYQCGIETLPAGSKKHSSVLLSIVPVWN